jgi:hypothetical protein
MMNTLKQNTLLTLTFLTTLSSQAEVNLRDGSYYRTWVDLEIPTPGYVFQLRRSYDSRSLHPGIFGYGWCSDFEKSLEFRRSDQIVLRDCKLKKPIKYQRISPTQFQSPEDPQELLELRDQAYLRRTLSSLQKYNLNGQLVTLSNHHGFHLYLQYGPQGSLLRLNVNSFAEIVFKMDRRRRLIQDLRTVGSPLITYRYDGTDLISATNAWKDRFDYRYDEVHNLVRISYPDKTFEELTYDTERDWILHVRTRDQCQENFKWTLLGAKDGAGYRATATRSCEGQRLRQTARVFAPAAQKRRISSTGDMNAN